MLDKTEVQTGIAVTVLGAFLIWMAKRSYSTAIGKWRAGVSWIEAMDAAKTEIATLKTTIAAALDPTEPGGIQGCIRAIDAKMESIASKLTDAIAAVSDKVSINHAMRVIELDRIVDPVVTFCRELRLVYANKAALKIMGAKSLDELRGHAWKDKILFDTIERAELAMQKAAHDFRPCTINVILRSTQSDGKSIQLALEPVISEKHEFCGFTGVVVDLSQRHSKAREMIEETA